MIKLEISLKRVQTFIFEVPRLKAMLGANALIGQVMRHELTELLDSSGKQLTWPESVTYPLAEDPLCDKSASSSTGSDDPQALFTKGILARDGGRFIAVFNDDAAATDFKKRAEERLTARLPGVLFDIEVKTAKDESKNAKSSARPELQLCDLPVLQVCQETGVEPATEALTDDGKRPRYRAQSVIDREAWGTEFYAGKTRDVVGLLRSALYPKERGSEPDDLGDLASNGYIALIHADGNGIGKRYKEWRAKREKSTSDFEVIEAHGEAFFHSMRVAVRRALVDSLDVFAPIQNKRSYEVLMLGGDDLLLVCRADKALDFSVRYATALKDKKLADGKPLDVAIGVAIAKKTYPLHRLHDLAEHLASSAKRLYRGQAEGNKSSVIDWQVVTQSWFEDVAEARRAGDMVRYKVNDKEETLLLSGKPYAVCGENSLETLLEAAGKVYAGRRSDREPVITNDENARSPLRALRQACERGRRFGEMAFDRLPESQRKQLGETLWKKHEVDKEGTKRHYYVTGALDIIGIGEIGGLGRSRA